MKECMPKTRIAMMLMIDKDGVISQLQEACEKLKTDPESEFVLDFSSVRRVDAAAVLGLERLAAVAGEKTVNVALRGVNVDIYKVLKLVKLAPRFSFLN
jgi:anti-anti-sigma regulatory factor